MSTANDETFPDYGKQFARIYDEIFPRDRLAAEEVTWLTEKVPSEASVVVELGVGTGRVALPLQAALRARGQKVRFIGVDISAEMLSELARADKEGTIERRLGDIASLEYEVAPDIVICVCATVSMLRDPKLQQSAIRRAAEALKPGGKLIIETHHAAAVSAMHVYESIIYCIPYPGLQRALVSFSTLNGNHWHIDHAWLDGGTATFASEDSRLTTFEELDRYAINCGLIPTSHTQGLSIKPITEASQTVSAVYEKPVAALPRRGSAQIE